MYLFSVERYLQELSLYRPDIVKVCQETVKNIHYDMDFIRLDDKIFRNCPQESIDYAVMEKTKDAVVATMDIGWNDVGAWSSLWELGKKTPLVMLSRETSFATRQKIVIFILSLDW